MPIEIISGALGFLLTWLVFSYLIGDNSLFRITLYIFIGVTSGYAVVIVWQNVLLPKLLQPLASADVTQLVPVVVPLVLSVTLLAKLSPRFSWAGSFAMALLVGVGAATALGGAVIGTLLPQARGAMEGLNFRTAGGGLQAVSKLGEGIVMLTGTVLTLAYFQFSASRSADGSVRRLIIFEFLAWGGRIFIAITLGVLFAGVYMAALTALIERLSATINFVKSLLGL